MPVARGQKIKFRPITDCCCGDHSFVATTKGFVTLVSAQDRSLLEMCSWSAHAVRSGLVYATCSRYGLLHRLITNAAPSFEVDHWNRNGCDNRRGNLRICSKSLNMANMKTPVANSSGFKGVSFLRSRGKWRARITVARQERHLGLFDTRESAAEAYAAAARSCFGEFARLTTKEAL